MVSDVEKRISDLENRVTSLERVVNQTKYTGLAQNQTKKKPSIKEFLISKRPSNDVERSLAIGYFFEKFEGFESFNADDLRGGFERAREKKPLNINDKINLNIRKGYLDEATDRKDGNKAWYLTSSGENFVEHDLLEGNQGKPE